MGYSLHDYYENGRDGYITRYLDAKNIVYKKLLQEKRKIDTERIERDLNAFFYPTTDDPTGIQRAKDFLDVILSEKMEFIGGTAVQNGLDTVPFADSKVSNKNLMKNYNTSTGSPRGRGRRYFEILMSNINDFRIKAIKQYSLKGEKESIKILEDLWTQLQKDYLMAVQISEEEMASSQKYKNSKNPLIYHKSMPLSAHNFGIFFTTVNTIFENLGYVDFNTVQLGIFFEEVLTEFFNQNKTAIIEGGIQQSMQNVKTIGAKRVYMGDASGVQMSINFSNEQKQAAQTTLKSLQKSTNLNNIKTDIKIVSRGDFNTEKQQKADVEISYENGNKLGISAKNWGHLYNETIGGTNQTGMVHGLLPNGIAQTFQGVDYVYDFLYMMQDNPNDSSGGRSGYQAIMCAKEMAKIGVGVASIMGLSQGKDAQADLFIANDRAGKKIYVANIADLVLNLCYHERNKSKYGFVYPKENTNLLNKLANELYTLSNREEVTMDTYTVIAFSRIHEIKLGFYFKVK